MGETTATDKKFGLAGVPDGDDGLWNKWGDSIEWFSTCDDMVVVVDDY